MIRLDWHEIAFILSGLVATGGVIMALLRGFFQSKKGCKDTQTGCNRIICGKIDSLTRAVTEDRQVVMDHYAEIKGLLGMIGGKLDKFNGGK